MKIGLHVKYDNHYKLNNQRNWLEPKVEASITNKSSKVCIYLGAIAKKKFPYEQKQTLDKENAKKR